MTVQPIQAKIEDNNRPVLNQKQAAKSYLDAQGAVTTEGLVKPLPGKGHLIHDTVVTGPKYFFKDIAYDMKSIKNGFNGTANDHQLGRLNDVGLRLGGIGIAAYLASRTTDPKARLMEYTGLIAFLISMAIFPKIAINKPAKLIHGFDIDKQYIDDQGRKKSVLQDPKYVPFDLYRKEARGEDLEKIGNKLGIPRGIKNRDSLTEEQMKKIGIQNNTLWMLTAGFATPVMAALGCCGFEYLIRPELINVLNKKCDKDIEKLLNSTKEMTADISAIGENELSTKIGNILSNFANKEMPESEFKYLVEIMTEKMDANVSEGIKSDLENILRTGSNGSESFIINSETIEEIISGIKNSIPNQNRAAYETALTPSAGELEEALKKIVSDINFEAGKAVSRDDVIKIKDAVSHLLDQKAKKTQISQDSLDVIKNKTLPKIQAAMEGKKSLFLNESVIKDITDFAKVIGEFKDNQILLDKCKHTKFEEAPQTIIAHYYNKFETALLKQLGIKYKDLKKMRESDSFTKKILDEKLSEISKDEARYTKMFNKLANIMSEMETALHGSEDEKSKILDLINAIENNYNNTAERLDKLGKFNRTADKLVKNSPRENLIVTKENVFDFLDGIMPIEGNLEKSYSGSSKNLEISRIVERYQGSRNSMYRILHTFEIYHRAASLDAFGTDSERTKQFIEIAKNTLLEATSSEHTQKLYMLNDSEAYKQFMTTVWKLEEKQNMEGTKLKGYVTEWAKKAVDENAKLSKGGSILDRFQYYISKFLFIIGNDNTDFTKPNHSIGYKNEIYNKYPNASRNSTGRFNLLGQSPVDMAKKAAEMRYGSLKWLRMTGGIGAGVLTAAILAQFCFGKIRNPHNVQKQVKNETN